MPELDLIMLLKAITYKKRVYYVTEGNYGRVKRASTMENRLTYVVRLKPRT